MRPSQNCTTRTQTKMEDQPRDPGYSLKANANEDPTSEAQLVNINVTIFRTTPVIGMIEDDSHNNDDEWKKEVPIPTKLAWNLFPLPLVSQKATCTRGKLVFMSKLEKIYDIVTKNGVIS